MPNITQILSAIDAGDPLAAAELLPLVYDELRQLAAAKMSHEHQAPSLHATALVHEAYLRLVDVRTPQLWNSRGHFFAAAAEAMRRILIEAARRRATRKQGGDLERVDLPEIAAPIDTQQLDLLALNDALAELEIAFPDKAQHIKLRFFAGLTLEEAADCQGISRATAQRYWTFARAWLFGKLGKS
ncbi:MAG: ECF-type sigma factor [Pirellulales bacterium]|nr:ECF-type sigma factor [Pirellulales bacterium]